ncbi:hypothetical protein JCM1841_006870 [Sporobolomyces salmonicolor]
MPRGFLSSQPKRNWGDDEEDENERPEFSSLNSQDWPPSPPPKPRPPKQPTIPSAAVNTSKGKAVIVGAAVTSKAASQTSAGGMRGAVGQVNISTTSAFSRTGSSASTSRPLAAKPSFTKDSAKPLLAPIFRKTPAASTSSSGPTASTSSSYASSSAAAYAFNQSSASTLSSSTLPKKRHLPWDDIEQSTSKSSRSGGSTSFHELSGPAGAKIGPGLKGKMLTSSSMDIKQKVILSPEQQMVHKLVVDDGRNVFFTGSAGTGKSVLLREIIASLKRKHRGNADAVAVTASTGMAACNIGGTTIHSFAGIGIGIESAEQLIEKVKKNRNANAKWQRVRVLVIDEVSMLDGILFDKLAKLGTALKKRTGGRGSASSAKPFGGIQLVITGDFFQLPPVTKGVTPTFAFEAQAWKSCIDHTVNLTQVFRQKDTEFIDMLNEMRFGKLSQESIKKFYSLSREPAYNGIEPTELFPMRHQVEHANQNRLKALQGDAVTFKADDWALNKDASQIKNDQYIKNFMAPETLVLKPGAQVMLIKNLDVTLVNGTVGTVVGFGLPELENDEDDGEGMAFDGGTVKSEMSTADVRKKQKIAQAVAQGKLELGPMVDWQTPNGIERKIMVREEFKVEDNKGSKLAHRRQYPIILAWAMSIHKSQGQTIARVKVDLGKVFEKGQSYVALSRATSLDGLQVLNFNPNKVLAHEKVIEWSRSLQVLS